MKLRGALAGTKGHKDDRLSDRGVSALKSALWYQYYLHMYFFVNMFMYVFYKYVSITHLGNTTWRKGNFIFGKNWDQAINGEQEEMLWLILHKKTSPHSLPTSHFSAVFSLSLCISLLSKKMEPEKKRKRTSSEQTGDVRKVRCRSLSVDSAPKPVGECEELCQCPKCTAALIVMYMKDFKEGPGNQVFGLSCLAEVQRYIDRFKSKLSLSCLTTPLLPCFFCTNGPFSTGMMELEPDTSCPMRCWHQICIAQQIQQLENAYKMFYFVYYGSYIEEQLEELRKKQEGEF